MEITREMVSAIKEGVYKIKKIEAASIPQDKVKDSAWLIAIYDIIDRAALAIRDELENVK